MLSAVLQFIALSAVIVVAGTVLTRCADAIAEITGLGRLLVGGVLLAGATSLPELTVDLAAIRLNLPDMAIGDLLGSSLMNLLILAVLDLMSLSHGKMLSRAGAAHAMSGAVVVALTSVVGIGLITAPLAPQARWLGVHASLWVVAIGYFASVRMVYLDQRIALRESIEARGAPENRPSIGLVGQIGKFAAAAIVIVLAGPRLADAAGVIADESGLGGSFMGTTFVALCTSLPELVTSITALRMGAFDLVIGNVFGSNAFNMLLFVPLDLAYPETLFAVASPAHLVTAFGVILATAVVVMGQLYQQESRTPLLEPDAWIVIVIVAGALTIIYFMS